MYPEDFDHVKLLCREKTSQGIIAVRCTFDHETLVYITTTTMGDILLYAVIDLLMCVISSS